MESSQYSIQIMLPKAVDRRLRKWGERTPGASWPAWGGHITLMPRFQLLVPRPKLYANITAVCTHYRPLDIHLTSIVAMQDWTREAYRGVFLVPPAESGSGVRRLTALQHEFGAVLGDEVIDLAPEVTRRKFAPHITLALGVSELEAEKMVSQARAEGIVAEFTVARVWLLEFKQDENGDNVIDRTAFHLSSPMPEA